jgi:outer membrane protein assembly factor BamD (BamD/ComL family)
MIGQGPNETKAKEAYTMGETLFKEKKYKEAAGYFKTAYKRAPDTPIEEDAMFMRGESLFFADIYGKASDDFSNLLKKYENSRYLDKVVVREFAIARYWEATAPKRTRFLNFTDKSQPVWDNLGNAIAIYDSIHMHDPLGPLADDAAMASANNYFLRGDWENAAAGYDTVRKFHSDSPFQPQAHLLGLRAKLNSYQGPQYEGKVLRQSDELADQILNQFADQLPGERERLLQVKKTIRELKAQREYEAGEYYCNTKYYRAAGYYYRTVVKDFPDTPYADMARKRLDEIKDLPPTPKQHFIWLVKLLSTHKDL